MLRLHHLNNSRSERILWLLQELGQPYEVINYERDAKTQLAPASLKAIHPLGKAPVLELDGQILSESGAIVEILIERFAKERLRPAVDSPEYNEYIQWIHFAESSLMTPLLLDTFIRKDGCETNFIGHYAIAESAKVLGFLDHALNNKRYLVADKLTGADIMLSFVIAMLEKKQLLKPFANLEAYAKQLKTHASWHAVFAN